MSAHPSPQETAPHQAPAAHQAARAGLLLTWPPSAHASDISTNSPTRDRGLWLLAGSAVRQAQWHRLRAAIEAKPPIAAPPTLYDTFRRATDVAIALTLLLLLAPLFAVLAILIRLDSPGRAIFCQHRVGRDGRPFLLFKFRSMHSGVRPYAISPATATDPRITRLGRILRRTSLDELPQLLNVLRGDMSLIGPRPEMPFIVRRYTQLQRRRLAVRPGMTGLWQISPARSEPIHDNLSLDLHYIRHRNLALDAAILVRTLIVVVRGGGTA